MSGDIEIRSAQLSDAAAIAEIYNAAVESSHATFDLEAQTVESFQQRIASATELHCWFVAAQGDTICGYSCASPWKPRRAYARTVETSVYVRTEFGRQGLGTRLYRTLLDQLEAAGVHTILGGIALPNDVSAHMHEKFGFERAGVLREVGYKFDRWIDVEYWQLRVRG